METTIRETWLSRKPSSWAEAVSAFSTLLLVIGSVLYWQNIWDAYRWMPASFESVFQHHEWWRAWTTLFVHGDSKHLLSNSFLFFVIGTFLTGYFGILVFPLIAFFVGGLTNLIVLFNMSPKVHLIGASGVVFWMGGAWLILYFLLDRNKTIYQRTLRSIGVALVLFMPAEAFDPHVSYATHFVGFVLGALFGYFYYLSRRKQFLAAEVVEILEEAS